MSLGKGVSCVCATTSRARPTNKQNQQFPAFAQVCRQQVLAQQIVLQALHHQHTGLPAAVPAQPCGCVVATAAALQGGQSDHLQQQAGALKQQQHREASQRLDGTADGTSSSSSSSSSWALSSGLLPWPDAADTVDSQQQVVCEALRVSPDDAQLLMLSCQAANTLSRQQLADNWALLQQLLPVQKQLLLHALLRLPDLLQQPQQTLHARLADAAEVLQLPVQQLLKLRSRKSPLLRYRLLLMSKRGLEAKMEQLQQVLGVKGRLVVQLVCAEPQLLTLGQARLISSVEALEQVCGLRLERFVLRLLRRPQLLMTPAEQLYEAAAALQQQLHLSEEGLALALRRAPGALGIPAGMLDQLLQELSAALAVNRDVAADILLQEPELLLRQPGAVGAVLGLLRSTFRLNAESLLQVVQFDPFVLGASPGELQESTGRFKQLASRHKAWAQEYWHLMSRPVNVARGLRIEPLRLQRLHYLTQQRLAATVSLKTALTMSGRQFVLAYPRYRAWLAQHYSHGEVPHQYRWQLGRPDSDDEEDEEEDDDD